MGEYLEIISLNVWHILSAILNLLILTLILKKFLFARVKDVSFAAAPFGIPEIIGCAVVTLLHIWKRNTLLSIGAGTVCYMLLVQFVF